MWSLPCARVFRRQTHVPLARPGPRARHFGRKHDGLGLGVGGDPPGRRHRRRGPESPLRPGGTIETSAYSPATSAPQPVARNGGLGHGTPPCAPMPQRRCCSPEPRTTHAHAPRPPQQRHRNGRPPHPRPRSGPPRGGEGSPVFATICELSSN